MCGQIQELEDAPLAMDTWVPPKKQSEMVVFGDGGGFVRLYDLSINPLVRWCGLEECNMCVFGLGRDKLGPQTMVPCFCEAVPERMLWSQQKNESRGTFILVCTAGGRRQIAPPPERMQWSHQRGFGVAFVLVCFAG
eukprot:365129-Chlamydomonas_euryale.AAC.16